MATEVTNTVIGYFRTRAQAEKTIEDLKSADFRPEQLGVASNAEGITRAAEQSAGEQSSTPQTTESVWDKIVHFFGGKEGNDSVYHPDDFRGSLQFAGVTRESAQYFEYQLGQSDSGALVTVSASGREHEAEQIIERNGGDVGRNAATFQYPSTQPQSEPAGEERRRIQLLGEVLRVHKERVPTGEVRLRKEVITETQNVQVPVSREELIVERHAGGQTSPEGKIGQDSEIRIPLSEERVNVEKRPTVREEVEVGKRTREDTREVSEQVRHEELRVENDANVNLKDSSNVKDPTAETPKVRKRGA